MKHTLSAALVLLAAACAPAAAPSADPALAPVTTVAAAPALNPLGTFEFTTSVNGNPMTGTIEVTGGPGAYGGVVRTSATPDLPITGVVVEGDEMTVTSSVDGETLTMRLTFAGNDFTGGWTVAGDSGDLAGRRRP
jgi:hypothetical protein